jgi:uncharacterized protein (TIGR03118 family)
MRLVSHPASLSGFVALVLAFTSSASQAGYAVTNLVSDIPGLAANIDPNLKNPWGVAVTGGGVFWVSDQGNNMSTLYTGSGSKIDLQVAIPTTSTGPQGPTGQVLNGNGRDFVLSSTGQSASFLFANLNGQISGWAAGLTTAQTVISGTNAVYTGLAIGQVGSDNVIFAADSKGNKIDVYSSTFQNLNGTTYSGAFKDPSLPAGFTVFGIQNINGIIYVTYDNSSTANGGNVATNGGVVAAFGLDGHFISQFSNGPGGPLEDPWGVVMAPTSFGQFGGDLLVGDKESGQINAFDPTSGAFLGLVATVTNDPNSTNNALWGLSFGAGPSSDPNTLYAFAGINNEADGLMVAITSVPEPGSAILLGLGVACALAYGRRRLASRRA